MNDRNFLIGAAYMLVELDDRRHFSRVDIEIKIKCQYFTNVPLTYMNHESFLVYLPVQQLQQLFRKICYDSIDAKF